MTKSPCSLPSISLGPLLLSFALCTVSTAAQAHHAAMTKRAERVLANYEVIAQPLECAQGKLKRKQVVDDNHIIFRMRGGDLYLADLIDAGKCQGLWKYKRATIEGAKGQYCRGARVKVTKNLNLSGGRFPGDLQAGTLPGGFCHIGAISKIKRRERAQ